MYGSRSSNQAMPANLETDTVANRLEGQPTHQLQKRDLIDVQICMMPLIPHASKIQYMLESPTWKLSLPDAKKPETLSLRRVQ